MGGGDRLTAGEVAVSVVVGTRPGEHSPRACLDALAAQRRPGVEVVVAADAPFTHPVADTVVVQAGAAVPDLWAAGIRRATGARVALLSGVLVPAPDWLDRVDAADLDTAVAVGGAIDPGPRLRLRDWAAYFCRYARYQRPLADDAALDLAGDNACYRRDVLERYAAHYDDGFWEPVVHQAMRRDGLRLALDDSIVVRQPRGISFGTLARQRVRHGRRHGRDRAAATTRRATVVAIVTAALVPWVMAGRAARATFARARHRVAFVGSLPLLVLLYSCWAYGELLGGIDALRGRS